jgi:putative ABC transport system permease protein
VSGASAPLAVLLFRAALCAHPPWVRDRYGVEMEAAFRAAYGERRLAGRAAAARYALRALADVVRSGTRERRSARWGAGAPASGERVPVGGRPRGGGGMSMGEWWTDVRVAGRALGKTPGFTLAAVAVLALGIGANAAVFSAVKATLLTPPPYPDPDRLVMLDLTEAPKTEAGQPRAMPWSYPKYRVMAAMNDVPLQASAAYATRSVTLTGAGDAAFLSAEAVTPDYLRVLGLAPSLGRDFTADDDVDGAGPVVMLEHGLWRDRFGGDRSIVGRTVTLNGQAVTVVGVAPVGFRGLTGGASLLVPVHTGAALVAPFLIRGAQAHWLRVIGRLAPGASLTALNQRMAAVGTSVEATYPDSDPTVVRSASAQAFMSARVNEQARRSVLVLAAAAGLLLLVACANLAGLLVARAGGRTREAAVRVAMGAGRWRVARGFLVEALLLAVAGGALAVLVARFGAGALAAAWPRRFLDGSWNVRGLDRAAVAVDPGVVAFAALVAVVAGLLFGALPALSVSQVSPARQLRAGTAGAGGARHRLDVRGALVSGEIALALVLLVGAGLLLRSLRELQAVDRGFRPGNLVTFSFNIGRGSRWSDDVAGFNERYLERLTALPDVESATVACVAPLAGHCMITDVRRAGDRSWSEGSRPRIGVHYVSDGFFETLGVPVREGRTFTSEDRKGSRPVVVLSEAAVRELFPDGGALGRPVAMGTDLTSEEGSSAEVIGVVGDVLFDTPEKGVIPEAFISERQEEGYSTFIVRTRGEPLAAIPGARAALAALDPDIPLHGVSTLDDIEASATADTRVLGGLLATFAGLALLLACTGVWAVVAYAVAKRTSELGLRVALGAEPGQVVALVVRGGLALAAVGVLAGSLGAWGASRVLKSQLYGVAPTDPVTFVAAAALLMAVAAAAAWLPARRATRVDPMVALRAE